MIDLKTFNREDWFEERISRHSGYRNSQTQEWVCEREFLDAVKSIEVDYQSLLANWDILRNKLDAIAAIPSMRAIEDMGKEFHKMEIDDDGATYHTETYFCSSGSDYYSFFIPWTDINKPISFFEEKYNKKLEEKNKAAEERKNADEEKQRQKDLAEFNRLKNKLQM